MHKSLKLAVVFIFIFCLFLSGSAQSQSDSLTITTYYPSPYGDYNQLTTHNNTNLATDGGSVGIGTTGPAYKLDVYTPASTYPARVRSAGGYLIFGPANTSWNYFVTDRPRSYFDKGITVDSGEIASYNEPLYLQAPYGSTRMTISNSNGYVGIATSPSYPLHVYRSGYGTTIRAQAGSYYMDLYPHSSWAHILTNATRFYMNTNLDVDGGMIGSHNENLQLQTSRTTRMTILNSNGYVGIAFTNPAYRLDVNGTIRCYGWVICSSKDCKKEIRAFSPSDYKDALNTAKNLNLYHFRYKDKDKDTLSHIGLLAEDAPQELLSSSGKEIDIPDTIGFLLAIAKAQQEKNYHLEQRIKRLEKEVVGALE